MDVVSVVVYYGRGCVRTNESGVDLSEFENVEIQLTQPEKARISDVQSYFTANFGFDPNFYSVVMEQTPFKYLL